jgi:DNA-binding NtrC family response regulator
MAEQRHRDDEERQRQRQQEDDLRALQMDYRRQQAELELTRIHAENEEKLRALRKDLRKSSVQSSVQLHTEKRVQSASDSTERDAQKEAVAQALTHDTQCNRTHLAAQIGVSRRKLYMLIDELKQEGLL